MCRAGSSRRNSPAHVRDGIVAAGYDIVTSRPEAFAAFLKADIAKWGRVIKEARIQTE